MEQPGAAGRLSSLQRSTALKKFLRESLLQYGLILPFYVAIHIYLGMRGFQSFGYMWMSGLAFAIIVAVGALSFPMTAGLDKVYIKRRLVRHVAAIGFYWIPFTIYILFGVLLMDFVRLVNLISGRALQSYMPAWVFNGWAKTALGFAYIGVSAAIIAWGAVCARRPRVTRYDIHLNARDDGVKRMDILMLSDLHLGTTTGTADIVKLRGIVNAIRPDMLFLVGDITDCPIYTVPKLGFDDMLRSLDVKHGIYGVFGNHEHMNAIMGAGDGRASRPGHNAEGGVDVMERLRDFYKQAGVRILRDEHACVEGINIVGREDRSVNDARKGACRASMQDLMDSVDTSMPVIVLDHQPMEFASARNAGADIMLSGHTHRGQFFPMNILAKKKYKRNYGHTVEDGMHLIVSSGFGTWGPPMRLNSRSEVVQLTLHFG